MARKATATAKKAVKNGKKAEPRSAQPERRRFERAPINAQVEYELTNSSSGPSRVRRNMANISTGGMFITTEERIRAGTRMVVRFELPNRHRVIAVSRVSYAKEGSGLGVEFLSLDEEDLEEIQNYITSMKENADKSE
ncbi:MAG: PilZ domain-containing protein [Acidobacteriota bacterium]